MISSRNTPQNEPSVPSNQWPFPEDWSYGYTDEQVDAMNADMLSAVTVPVGQIQDDDEDEDVLTIIGSSGGFNLTGSMSGGSAGMVVGSGASGINGSAIMSAGGGAYTIANMIGQLTLDLSVSQEPDLPSIVFNGYDFDEKKIVMTLKPESTISTLEVFKILLLINAATHAQHKFSVFAYIKKNNLERHFKFAQ